MGTVTSTLAPGTACCVVCYIFIQRFSFIFLKLRYPRTSAAHQCPNPQGHLSYSAQRQLQASVLTENLREETKAPAAAHNCRFRVLRDSRCLLTVKWVHKAGRRQTTFEQQAGQNNMAAGGDPQASSGPRPGPIVFKLGSTA
jgi:hypothetical protein